MFLDEVNTSSCLGLFKEVIVDRSFDGEVMLFVLYIFCDHFTVGGSHLNIPLFSLYIDFMTFRLDVLA